MANETFHISDIIMQMPQKLQRRFESLGKYVRGLIDEESSRLGSDVVLSREDIQLIQLAALVYTLDSFFRAGSSAARTAAATFEEFGVSGFQVGRTVFTSENLNTRRGDRLANVLEHALSDLQLGGIIQNASSMTDLISTLIRELNDGEALD